MDISMRKYYGGFEVMKSIKRLTKLYFVCFMVLVACVAQADDIYVDDDNTLGPWDGTLEHPYQYIQDGIDVAAPMDRVLVCPGTYEENIALKGRVEVRGNGDVKEVIITSDSGNIVSANSVVGAILSGLTIDGQESNGHGIYCYDSSIEIRNNSITQCGSNGIYCESSSNVLVENNDVNNCSSDGITYYHSSGTADGNAITACSSGVYCDNSSPTISNNEITYVSAYGIYCHGLGGNSSPRISNNTIKNCSADGIRCYASSNGCASPDIINNTITKCGNNGIQCTTSYNQSYPVIRENKIFQNEENGVVASWTSLPDLGTADNPGNNEIYWNTRYDVDNSSGNPIMAEGNWWGECPPNPAYFHGDIDYDPWLCPPTVDSVKPISRGQGATGQDIVITGENFMDRSVVSFCDGITVNSTTFVSSTELIANINIASDAPVGVCDVTVTNPIDQMDTGVGMFEVTNAPIVTSTNPDGVPQGAEKQDVTIIGSGFVDNPPDDPNGPQLAADFGDGITVNSVTFVSETELIANISIADDADCGLRDVTVVNGDAGVGIGAGIFRVLCAPTISVYTDKEVYQPDDEMWVHADFSNHTDGSVMGIAALFLVKLKPILRLYKIRILSMPPGYDEQGYEFHYESSPPVDKPGTYAWLGALFSKKDGCLDYSVCMWSYEISASAADVERIKQIAEEYAKGLTLNAVLNMKPAEAFEKDAFAIPAETMLFQNNPNPFNPETWIPYQLAEDTDVKIKIYNVTGKLVRRLDLGRKETGLYLSKSKAAYWDGRDYLGQKVASGVYFYTLQAGKFRATRKMVILK